MDYNYILQYYSQFLSLQNDGIIRVQLMYPDDYIKLLKRVDELEKNITRLKDIEFKYCCECYRSLELQDKLNYVHSF